MKSLCQSIKIYIDESGDPGYSDKSSNYFVIAGFITSNEKRIKNCLKRIRERRLKKRFKKIPELKFHHSDQIIRKRILKCITSIPDIQIFYVLLKKNKDSYHTPLEIYSRLLSVIIEGIITVKDPEKIEIIMDWTVSNDFISNLEHFMECRFKIPVDINHVNSMENPCIQAADFVAGAILKHYEHSVPEYLKIIESRIVYSSEIRF